MHAIHSCGRFNAPFVRAQQQNKLNMMFHEVAASHKTASPRIASTSVLTHTCTSLSHLWGTKWTLNLSRVLPNASEDHGLGCKATDLTEHTAWDRGLFADNEQFLLFCPHEFLPRCLRPPTLTVLSQTLHDASLPPKHTSRSPQSTGREKQQQRRPWRQDRCTPSDKHGASNEQTSGCEEAQYRVRSASSVNRRNRESDRIRGASTVSSKFPTSAAVSNGVQEERQSRVPAAPRTARTHQCRTPRRSWSSSNNWCARSRNLGSTPCDAEHQIYPMPRTAEETQHSHRTRKVSARYHEGWLGRIRITEFALYRPGRGRRGCSSDSYSRGPANGHLFSCLFGDMCTISKNRSFATQETLRRISRIHTHASRQVGSFFVNRALRHDDFVKPPTDAANQRQVVRLEDRLQTPSGIIVNQMLQ